MKNGRDRHNVLLLMRGDLLGVVRLPRILQRAGCRVTLFAPRGTAVQRTRYLDRHIVAPRTSDEYLRALKEHLAEHLSQYRWVIIGDENLLHEIARRQGEEWLNGWFPVDPRTRAVELIVSKFPFLQAAAEAGLPVPRFRICKSLTEAWHLGAEYGYPLILKQPTSMSGSGVRKVWGKTDLAPQYIETSGGRPVMVQQCVSGLRGQTEVLYEHGRPIWWESSYTVASWPNELAASCVRETMDHPDIEAMLTGIGSLTGFHGLGGVDWIYDPLTHAISLVEFNARPTPGCQVEETRRQSFSDAVREMMRGDASVHRPDPALSGATVHMFPQAVFRAIDDRSPKLLIQAFANLPWGDPGLVLALLKRVAGHYRPRSTRNRPRKKPRSVRPVKGVRVARG